LSKKIERKVESNSSIPSFEEGISSLLAFMKRYQPHRVPLPYASMHKEWDEVAVMDPAVQRFFNFQAHRESAKSTIWAEGYPLWRICLWLWMQTQGQPGEDEHGAVLGVTDEEARANLRQIKYELTRNALIKQDFNPKKGAVWDADRIILDGATDVVNPTLQASSLTSFKPGARLTFVILNDTTSPLYVTSRLQRDRQADAFNHVVEPALKDNAAVVAVHTTYHNDDLPNRLRKDSRFMSKRWPLVIDEENRKVQWPEAWPWRRVLEKKRAPLVFARQYQLRDVMDEDRMLPMPEYYTYKTLDYIAGQFTIMGYPVTMATGIDPATSEKKLKGGSRTAIVTAAIFPNHDAFFVGAKCGRWGPNKVMEEVKATHQRWHPKSMFMEEISFGTIYRAMLIGEGPIPIRPSPAKGDKQARITGTLNPPMSNHKIKFPDEPGQDDGMRECIREFMEYPGETLDLCDAAEHMYRNIMTNPVYAVPASKNVVQNAKSWMQRGSDWIHRNWDR